MENYLAFFLLIFFLASCNEKEFKKEEGFLGIEDSKIHYKISGEGKPVVLLHGGFLNLDSWDEQVEDLNANNYQTIRYSDLGYGKTKNGEVKIKGTSVINEFVKRKCGDKKVSLVGLSGGGKLATDYVLKYPEKVDKLILVSPGINGWDWFAYEETKEKYEKLRAAYVENDSIEVGKLSYEYWIVGPNRKESDLDTEVSEKLKRMIDENIKENWGKSNSQFDTKSSINRLNEIEKPTLIILGDKDEKDIFAIGELYEKGIKGAEKVMMKDVRHSLNMEKPKAFNEIIIDFLKK